jgi:hypothetical protein
VYLDAALRDWQACEPDNPYVLALLPPVVTSDADPKAQAPELWQRVRNAPLQGKGVRALSFNR